MNDESAPKGAPETATSTRHHTARYDAALAALDYAARGWPVFPCKPGSKEPATRHGFKDSTVDVDVIRAWWARVPAYNVAIATGAPGPDVLDVDVKASGTGWPAFNRLKHAGRLAGASMLVSTRNGGLHAYYAGTDQGSSSIRDQYLDFKAAGGYVLAPPSTVPADLEQGTGRYELLEERDGTSRLDWSACRDLLVPPRRTAAYVPGREGDGRALADWLTRQPEGNRNHGLFWAACVAVERGYDLDSLRDAAIAAGLGEVEARRTIASAARRIGGEA